MKIKKIIYLSLAIFLIFGLYAVSISAAEFRFIKKGGNVTVSQDENVKNLYTAGNMISINGDIEKSLYAAGNVITINSNIENNVNVAGNTIVIRGSVGDSVHVAAGNIVIEGEIKEDLFLGGGNIIISKSASIGGDLIIGGGTVDIQGSVTGDIRLGGGEVIINSKVGGEIKAKIDSLTFGSQAEVVGKVIYSSSKEVVLEEGANLLGGIEFNEIKAKEIDKGNIFGFFFVLFSLGFLIKLLGTIAVGFVLIYVFKDFVSKIIRQGLSHFWSNLGRGFAVLILTPVACLILLVTIIGAWIAGLVGIAYAFVLLLSLALASIIFGSWLIKVIKKRDKYLVNWQAVVLGAIVLQLVVLIPFVGWIAGLIFMLIGLGAISKLIYQGVKK